MFVARVQPSLLNRLDAEYYEPEALAVEKAVRAGRHLTFGACVEKGYRVVYHGVDGVGDGPSIPFLAPTDISDLGDYTLESIGVHVPTSYRTRYAKGIAAAEELLVEVKGNTAKVAVVAKEHGGMMLVSGSLYKATLSSAMDPRFVGAFLASRVGTRLKRRVVSNINIAYIGKDDLYELPVPKPDIIAQRHIGSKVRNAELLRQWARMAETSFRDAVGVVVPSVTERGRQSRVAQADLDADLNPGRFTPDRLEVRRALTRRGARLVESFATISSENISEPLARSRYLGLDGISSTSIDLTFQSIESADVSGTCRVLPRGAAISKLRPYLNKAVFVPGGMGPVVGSTELLCVRSDSVHPGFIYGVLKLDTTVRQLNPVASGATHPRVGEDEVLDLLVPWHDDHERLGRTLERAQQAYFGARSLVTAARMLVEALIERRVTEVDLIAASKEPDVDRALLSRLRDDGLDGMGDALFPDLDALAELIAEASVGGAA